MRRLIYTQAGSPTPPRVLLHAQEVTMLARHESVSRKPRNVAENARTLETTIMPFLRDRQAASGPAGTNAPPGILQSAVQRTP